MFGSFASFAAESPPTSPENGPSWGVGAREILRVFRKKTSFSFVCKNVLHQVDKKALCSIRGLTSG